MWPNPVFHTLSVHCTCTPVHGTVGLAACKLVLSALMLCGWLYVYVYRMCIRMYICTVCMCVCVCNVYVYSMCTYIVMLNSRDMHSYEGRMKEG